MARRSNGEGSITHRKDGRWQASLQVDGRRRIVYGRTRAEAAARLEDLKRQADVAGRLPDAGKRTVGELLAVWLETVAPTLKPRTLTDYRYTCDRYLTPALGTLPLAKLTPERIARLCARFQAKRHNRTAQLVYRRLYQALSLAVRWGWLANNPCDRVDMPRHQAARKTLWTPAELRAFLDGAREHWLAPFWTFLVSSGCRLGEALALEWEDVDLAAGRARITKTVGRIGGEWVVTTPKTRAGERTLALPPLAVTALGQQAEWRLAHGSGSLVFAGPQGGPLSQGTVSHALRRDCERLDLPRMTPHGLRHLHASLLLAEGLPLPEVSRRLGHANPAITAAVYSHAIRDDAAAAAAIGRALTGAPRSSEQAAGQLVQDRPAQYNEP